MAAAIANLKRILAVCGDRKVYIITPLLRYINDACCYIDGPPPGPLLYCTQEQYSSLMNPPDVKRVLLTI